jgi:hypothetical protein
MGQGLLLSSHSTDEQTKVIDVTSKEQTLVFSFIRPQLLAASTGVWPSSLPQIEEDLTFI